MAKLLTRKEASAYVGIAEKSFDKAFRANPDFKRFYLSDHVERYTKESIDQFIETHERGFSKI
ncbi:MULTISPECIES: hypothetical protein [Lactobacillus]|uniref:hypothetical protein n=1 Tax=Lactobacillus TaxID=1578 RepID=UPI00191E5BA6|nr:hypothetical protein [Lactobacillus sp. A27]MBL1059186.1 hypothetical protein [Lactobacillus sp. A27]